MAKKPIKSKISRTSEDTATALVRAFLDLSGQQGVARITLQAVAKHAGIPFATAHHHFGGDKKDIRDEASLYVGKQAQEFISDWIEKASLLGENPLQAYFMGSLEWARLYPSFGGFWLYVYHVLSFDTEKRAAHATFVQVAQNRIHRLLLECVGRGECPQAIATADTAYTIHALLTGAVFLAITDPSPTAHADHSRRAWNGVLSLIRQ